MRGKEPDQMNANYWKFFPPIIQNHKTAFWVLLSYVNVLVSISSIPLYFIYILIWRSNRQSVILMCIDISGTTKCLLNSMNRWNTCLNRTKYFENGSCNWVSDWVSSYRNYRVSWKFSDYINQHPLTEKSIFVFSYSIPKTWRFASFWPSLLAQQHLFW